MTDLPPKQTATRNSNKKQSSQKQPTVSDQSELVKYSVKVLASITARDHILLIVCTTNAPDGKYFLQGINDKIFRQKLQVDNKYVIVRSSRLEVLCVNLEVNHPTPLRLKENDTLAELVKV
jgi:hypothetical protein